MSGDINSLVQQVHDYFLHLFQQQSNTAPGSTFLLFEPIGMPISQNMFKLHPTDTTYSPQLAVEQFSFLVNTVPDISADVFQRTNKPVDDFYDLILAGSLPTDANSDQLFTALKAQAEKKFEPTLGSLLRQLTQFHPSYATPNDWYDPGNVGNWATYSSNSSQSTTTSEIPPPIFHPIHPVGPWKWRLLPTASAASALVNQQQLELFAVNADRATNLTAVNPAAQSSQPVPTAVSEAAVHPIVETSVQPTSTASTVEATLKEGPVVLGDGNTTDDSLLPRPIDTAVKFSPIIIKHTTVQQVTSSTIHLSFSYCLVTIERDWLSQAFLTLPNWYVQGYRSGAFSNGTLQNNAGVFPVLPIACLVVKDVQLSAQWTQDDLSSIQQAASFGPFSLVGRTVDSTSITLTISGMQVIGWISQIMPLLPPRSTYPELASSYNGTYTNTQENPNQTFPLAFSSITEDQQGNIQGQAITDFHQATLSGSITHDGQLAITITILSGGILKLTGSISPDGHLAGTWVWGTWSVS